MHLVNRIKVLFKKVWRIAYSIFLETARRTVPEPAKKVILTILYSREQKIINQNQTTLLKILQEKQASNDYRTIIIFPPSLDWNVQLFQRPQQLAIALAKRGALVFYVQPKPDHFQKPFQLVCERLYLCPVHIDTFQVLPNPLIYLLTWNSSYASRFNHPRILYDYVDDIHAFYGDHNKIEKGHRYLVENATYILATAQKLYDEVHLIRPDVIFSPNGVEYEHFVKAARRKFPSPPTDLQPVLIKSNPIIGYYGALARWFDYDLIEVVAGLRPEYQFVLIGPDYDGTIALTRMKDINNIHCLGVKTYEELPHYLQFFDVAIIPFLINEITHATSPLKLFEYMASEKPIVITPMQESMQYPCVLVGKNPEEFANQIDLALKMREDQVYLSLLRHTAMKNTWEDRAEQILAAVERIS